MHYVLEKIEQESIIGYFQKYAVFSRNSILELENNMLVLVTYDVNTETAQGKRRLRNVAKACTKYGQRVQQSVFECEITSSQKLELIHELLAIIDSERDSLRFYNLGSKYSTKVSHYGRQTHHPLDEVLII